VPTPEELVVIVPGDVAYRLLLKAGLDTYRREHRGEHWRTDQVLLELSNAAHRWRELSGRGRNSAPNEDNRALSERMTTRQVADVTGVSDRTVRRAIANGHLTAQRAGRCYLIDRRDAGRYRTTR
jgi:excisionase family DNA binding protein